MASVILLVACAVLAGAVVTLAVAVRQLRSGVSAELTALRAELAAVERRPLVEEVAPAPLETPDEYVITRLGEPEQEPAPTVEARLFADLLMRESVVKAASLVYGVRRGLSPANRNRIRFEMRQEVKRARKERKAEEREAIREWRARKRAEQTDGRRESEAA